MTKVPEAEIEQMLTTLVEIGIVDSDVLRNFLIVKEYRELTSAPANKKCWQAREELSAKYYIDDRAIQYIIYDERKRKDALFKIKSDKEM